MSDGSMTGPDGAPERRRHTRGTFAPTQRPQLVLPLGRHDVLDASLGGLRILDASPLRPDEGAALTATLEWAHGLPALPVEGTIVRVTRDDYAVQLAAGTIPIGYLPWAAGG